MYGREAGMEYSVDTPYTPCMQTNALQHHYSSLFTGYTSTEACILHPAAHPTASPIALRHALPFLFFSLPALLSCADQISVKSNRANLICPQSEKRQKN